MLARLAIFTLIASTLIAAPGVVAAETVLRWRLKSDDTLVMTVEQHTESQVAFSGKAATTKIDLNLELAWDITAVTEEKIVIRQSVEKIKLKLAPPAGTNVEYDSSSTTRPTGQAREMADAMKSLIGAQFELEMNPRGEILSARPLNDLARNLLAGSDASADAAKASSDAVQRLLRQSIVVLPENKVTEGDEWKTASELSTSAGPLKQETTYRLAAVAERSSEPVCEITSAAILVPISPAGKTKASISIKSHEHTGTVLFSEKQGRLLEAEQTQKLTTERSYRETTITVTIASTQKLVLKPR